MAATGNSRDQYLIKSIVYASRLLAAFRSPNEALPLKEVEARSGLTKTKAFRLLYTLERCGMVEKVGGNLYRTCIRPFRHKLYRLGYASLGDDYQCSREVSASLQRAADVEGIELISTDNRYNAKTALRNADLLVREKVNLAIEYQIEEEVAPIIAAKYREANIPMIAIDIPHPGATFYGANNYEAGLIGGKYLGRWAKERWQSEVDEIILLELRRAGNLPKMRLTGMLMGINLVLPNTKSCRVTYLDGDGELVPSFEAMRRHLRFSQTHKVLVGANNDLSALGALRAFQEAGRTECCAIMGQDASPEGRQELRQPNTRLVGSVAYFPERYGENVIRVSLDILSGRTVPPAVFVKHKLVTPSTVDHYYPNDSLTAS
jgi:ribose transport system substrate-binding protein